MQCLNCNHNSMFEFTICPKCGYKPIESEIAESKKKMEEFAKTNYSLFKKEQVSKPKFNVNKQWKIFFVVSLFVAIYEDIGMFSIRLLAVFFTILLIPGIVAGIHKWKTKRQSNKELFIAYYLWLACIIASRFGTRSYF